MNVIDWFGTGEDSEYAFLSNFYVYDGWTVEHLYQAQKTDDPVWAQKILDAAPQDRQAAWAPCSHAQGMG